jgi:zinc and cadmium transporter
MTTTAILISVVATSLLATLGALLLVLSDQQLDDILPYLIALSTGAIFGGVFIHLIPKYSTKFGYTRLTGVVIAGSIGASFLLEKAIHWHCHHSDHDIEPYSYMLLIGDGLHNIFDGIIIASGYLIGFNAGLVATIGVTLHKIPKELGDFGTLLHGGFDKKKALLFNFGIGIFTVLGSLIVIVFSSSQIVENILLPVSIGNFIYIAGTDLFPEIREHGVNTNILALIFFTGVTLMYSIVLVKGALG